MGRTITNTDELTDQQVTEIRNRLAAQEPNERRFTVREVAKELDCSYDGVLACVVGRTHQHLDAQVPPVPVTRGPMLDAETVMAARDAVRKGARVSDLADHKYYVSYETLRMAVKGITWSHLDSQSNPVKRDGHKVSGRNWNAYLTRGKVIKARRLIRSGKVTITRLAERWGIERSTLAKAVNGTTWETVDDIEPPVVRYPKRLPPTFTADDVRSVADAVQAQNDDDDDGE